MKRDLKKTCISASLALAMAAYSIPTALCVSADGASSGETRALTEHGLSPTVEGGAILHCWCWDFNTIRENIPEIAAAGFSAVQTSPICEVNNGGDGSLTIMGGDAWWWHYQPTDYKIGNYQLGTEEEFIAMCETAHSYGVKVIVDSVLNHTTAYYDEISDNIKSLPGSPFHPMGEEREEGQNWSEVDRYEETQYDLSGLYDLNTSNKAVQNYILDFLKNCVEDGADGFRYDAAKLIELPDDTSAKYGSDFASDFWPTILQNGAYFQYGEVLQEGGRHLYKKGQAGYDDDDSSRLHAYHSQQYTDKDGNTHYMNTTNSFTGFRIRDAIANKELTAEFIMDPILPEGAKAEQTVTWVESHDNYCNDKSYTELPEIQQVIQGWAAIAARKDGTPLFFDRPKNSTSTDPWGDNKIGAAGSDMYKDPQVAAVNFFRNEMDGSEQRAINPIEGDNSVLLIERGGGNKGCVIINAGGEDVEISADTTMDDGLKMADGDYTDRAFGGAFTVTDGVLSGTVKAGKVAVVYAPQTDEYSKLSFAPAVDLSQASGYFLTDTLTTDVYVRSCETASYELSVNGRVTESGSVSAGDKITIRGVAHREKAVLTLTGFDGEGTQLAQVTREYTKWDKQDDTVLYIDPAAKPEWSKFYVYIWGSFENASWPGIQLRQNKQGLYEYVLPYQYELDNSYGNVIFNNSTGEQFDAGTIRTGEHKLYTADYRWIDYTETTSDTYSETTSDTDSETASDSDSETTPDTDSETTSDTDSETTSDTDSETASDTDSETTSDSESETTSDTDSELEEETNDEPKTQDEPAPETNDTPERDTDSETATPDLPEPDSDTDSGTDSDSDSETDSESDTDSDHGGEPNEPEDKGSYGDLDGDGQVTAGDALFVLRASAGMTELDPELTVIADIDGDGSITANDALAVLRYSVGIYDGTNIGNKVR